VTTGGTVLAGGVATGALTVAAATVHFCDALPLHVCSVSTEPAAVSPPATPTQRPLMPVSSRTS
jgi:hypothetical protein